MSIFRKSTLALLAAIILPAVVGMVYFPALFALIFGENWRKAGEFARWLLVWQAFLFCNVPSVLMARVLRMQREMLLFDVAALGLRLTALVLGGVYWTAGGCIAAFGLLGAALNLLLIVWIWLRVKRAGEPDPRLANGCETA